MGKTKVIVDTCFLQKVSAEGQKTENIKRVLEEFDYIPVVHPYVFEHELSLHSCFQRLADEGYLQVIPYGEFQKDADDVKTYEAYFDILYEDMRVALDAIGGRKQIKKLDLVNGQTIYNVHKQGSSMGDVHMVLMAAFMQMPVLLTEDSDIDLLQDIADRRIHLGNHTLEIFDSIQLMEKIAQKKDSSMTIKEVEAILKDMKERKCVARIKALWRENHG